MSDSPPLPNPAAAPPTHYVCLPAGHGHASRGGMAASSRSRGRRSTASGAWRPPTQPAGCHLSAPAQLPSWRQLGRPPLRRRRRQRQPRRRLARPSRQRSSRWIISASSGARSRRRQRRRCGSRRKPAGKRLARQPWRRQQQSTSGRRQPPGARLRPRRRQQLPRRPPRLHQPRPPRLLHQRRPPRPPLQRQRPGSGRAVAAAMQARTSAAPAAPLAVSSPLRRPAALPVA
jgi:hypothetical protein